jgi:hypothetical protein
MSLIAIDIALVGGVWSTILLGSGIGISNMGCLLTTLLIALLWTLVTILLLVLRVLTPVPLTNRALKSLLRALL